MMMLKLRLATCLAAAALSIGTVMPAATQPWVRGFVVSSYDFAFRYGGRPDFARPGALEPGVDCPHGGTLAFDADETRKLLARQTWRSQQEIDWIIDPPGLDRARADTYLRFWIWGRALSYRGYKPGIETYINPWAAEDPGQPEVISRIAEGFNLDGRIGPDDFVGTDGESGIDNALYRAWGCATPWRGEGILKSRANDSMRNGLYTMVIRISGNQDPMNDSDATLEIGYSPDKIVRDARGGVAVDYSYRILKSAQYTSLKATIRNGVVETEQVEHLHTPRTAWYYDQTGDTNFTKGKIRLKLASGDLSAAGLIGGYRNWRDLYTEVTFGGSNSAGAAILGHANKMDQAGMYFALRRNADGMYNAKTGQYDGISAAYRIEMSSAFVVDPDDPMDIPIRTAELWRKTAFEAAKVNTIKSIEIRVPQDVPPGTREAVYPWLESVIKDLPSKHFFLKLDRPHYPDGVGMDWLGNPIDDHGNRIDSRANKLDEHGNPVMPPQPLQQATNRVPERAATVQEQ
ncbi:hypothetical protein H8A99_05170 [Bradyrhizobium sp. Arg68]|uniref:hypothetical protein n=1 Tax=Bradyrhizobium ivorense TaxID=2511166 RepID=UPI001E478A5E|nr:hypothetical protein [Bradyrhizobium ivorense]MCC8935897.1 hypothetical protein [Bradyrhizobium ivorense]